MKYGKIGLDVYQRVKKVKLNRAESIKKINYLASNKIPFLLISDFEGKQSMICPLDNINSDKIKYWINGVSNYAGSETQHSQIILQKFPISLQEYQRAFDYVKDNILLGNSFLTNLTCATKIELNIDLLEVFERSEARYKVLLNDEFVCFSPEIFVQIDESGKISSFPMKGTIDATIPDAESIILNDKKEFYEHTTIVDLIRNDISKVADKVWVEKFRYIDKIQTSDKKEILQVSSQISGLLSEDWQQQLGDIIYSLLPAGSISGAPKDKTLGIIKEAEKYTYGELTSPNPLLRGEGVTLPSPTRRRAGDEVNVKVKRGFYTGICGIFDGKTFDSGVMIRFIEKTKNGLVYKSGGGITARSIAENEYQEMIQKIYVPII